MARGRGLYRQIAEPDNLREAFRKAVRGKSDRTEVIFFRRDLEDNLAKLRTELLTGELQFGPYRFFQVRDPKERTICAAPFRDRVLHHAVINLAEPVLERYSICHSYACRPGKGLHKAIDCAHTFTRRFTWYLKLDIRKYFDSIHHETLLELLARRFCDERLLALFRQLLASYQTEEGRGLPIGNLISQHFANFYLGLLDHWLLEQRKVPAYLRYMDDFLVFASDREQLKSELAEIERFLGKQLKLTLKDNRQLNRCSKGVPFLGFRLYPSGIKLAPRSRRRFVDRLAQYEQKAKQGDISQAELARRVHALVPFTQAADAAGFRRSIIINGRGWRPEGLEPRESRRQLEQQSV